MSQVILEIINRDGMDMSKIPPQYPPLEMPVFNVVYLMGRVSSRPVQLATRSGNPYLEFRLEVDGKYYDPATKEWVSNPSYFDVRFWRGMGPAQTAALTEGSPVLVEGSLQSDAWNDKNNLSRLAVIVVASRIRQLTRTPDGRMYPTGVPSGVTKGPLVEDEEDSEKSWAESASREELIKLLKSTKKTDVNYIGDLCEFVNADGAVYCDISELDYGVVGPTSLSEIDEVRDPELYKAFVAKGLSPETEAYYFTTCDVDKVRADDYTIEDDFDAATLALAARLGVFDKHKRVPWEEQEDETLIFWAEQLCEPPEKPTEP